MLTQKKWNVLTSGHTPSYYNNGYSSPSITSSQITDLLFIPEWQEIYAHYGNMHLYNLFTSNSLFYSVNETLMIQLSGPYLTFGHPFLPTHSFSIRSSFYHLSFPHHAGFPSHHLFHQLLHLNSQLTPSAPFAYRSIHRDCALVLLHEVFRPVYATWQRTTAKAEMALLQQAVATGQTEKGPRLRCVPRLEKVLRLLARLLFNLQNTPFYRLLNECAPLPAAYETNRERWQYALARQVIHSIYKNQRSLKEQEATQEQCLLFPSPTINAPSIEELTSTPTPSHQVFLFLQQCLHFLLPKALLGSRHNWRRFYSTLLEFVQSQSRDTFPLDAFTTGIELSSVCWLAVEGKPSSATARVSQALFQSLVSFIITSIIVRPFVGFSIDPSFVCPLLYHRYDICLQCSLVLQKACICCYSSRRDGIWGVRTTLSASTL